MVWNCWIFSGLPWPILFININELQFKTLSVFFEKYKLLFGCLFLAGLTPIITNPWKKKHMTKSSPTRSTPKQRHTRVQKYKIIKKSHRYGKQFYVKKDKLVNQNQTWIPNAPQTFRQGGNFRVILKFDIMWMWR